MTLSRMILNLVELRIYFANCVNSMIEKPNHRLIILAVRLKYSSKDIFSDISYIVVGSVGIYNNSPNGT